MNESPRFSLNKEDLKKVGKGAAMAGLGSALAYVAVDALPFFDFKDLAWLAPLLSILLNLGRKWVADQSK